MCASCPVDGSRGARTSLSRIIPMLTRSLRRCRSCRLKWFPKRGDAAACPACGSGDSGAVLEPFHAGIALVALALVGWTGQQAFGERASTAVPAVVQERTVTAEHRPARGETATHRRGEELAVAKREERRVLAKNRRDEQVYASSKKVKFSKVKRHKKGTRSQHVQR
jgi:hypothetical protein